MILSPTVLRRSAQLFVRSCGGRHRPAILANSIPKSGTHFVKAVLKGGGYRYAGHYGETEHSRLAMVEPGGRFFATAHLTWPVTGPGMRLLIYRDPVDVALSMAIYIRSRWDHHNHARLSGMDLPGAVQAIFEGTDDFVPLARRYRAMADWAKASGARPVDFADIRADPASLLRLVGCTDHDPEKVAAEIRGWNPTKRTKKDPQEEQLKHALRRSQSEDVQRAVDVYQEIKSLT